MKKVTIREQRTRPVGFMLFKSGGKIWGRHDVFARAEDDVYEAQMRELAQKYDPGEYTVTVTLKIDARDTYATVFEREITVEEDAG